MMEKIRLGTRKSPLAQAQTRWVAARLKSSHPELPVEIHLISTAGDKGAPSTAGTPGGYKTLFTKEIEDALLAERIDLAVHSMKDLAAEMPAGLCIGAVPEREDPRDVWVSKSSKSFQSMPAGARIGTGAVRRQAQLRHLRPDVELVPVRGNVDTRLAKLATGDLDGLILAWAGLARLGREDEATEILPAELLLPAVGQGCLCLQIRAADKRTQQLVNALDHAASRQAAAAERAFMKAFGGDCQTPIAAYARIEKDRWYIDGLVASLDGKTLLKDQVDFAGGNFVAEGRRLAERLLSRGAKKLLAHG